MNIQSPDPGSVVIRAVRLSDAAGWCAIANMPLYRHGTLRPPFQRVEMVEKWLAGLGPNTTVIVAEHGRDLVGTASLEQYAGRRAHVASIGMGVRDDCHGQGIGSMLLEALLDTADNWLNIHRVELSVFADNAAAIALYRKFGFEQEGVLRDYAFRDGRFADVLTMARLRQV
jgi:L-phenylalanine/L-methionine N-acetyltransferase